MTEDWIVSHVCQLENNSETFFDFLGLDLRICLGTPPMITYDYDYCQPDSIKTTNSQH